MPLLKFQAKKSKTLPPAPDQEAAETCQQVGFGAASAARRADMDKAGLAWRVAPATKDQKRADQARRRLLAGAKRLLK